MTTSILNAWEVMAREYLNGARVLYSHMEETSENLTDPWFQLTGHAVECALKCYLKITEESDPPHGHDLLELVTTCQASGLTLTAPQLEVIRGLNDWYHEHPTGRKYAARYPSPDAGVWMIRSSDPSEYEDVVDHVLEQAGYEATS